MHGSAWGVVHDKTYLVNKRSVTSEDKVYKEYRGYQYPSSDDKGMYIHNYIPQCTCTYIHSCDSDIQKCKDSTEL